MRHRLKNELISLCLSVPQSPCRTPGRLSSLEIKKPQLLSPSPLMNSKLSDKWSIKGHKLTALLEPGRKAKKSPKAAVLEMKDLTALKLHAKSRTSNTPFAMFRKKRKYKGCYMPPGAMIINRHKQSSKNLQVDTQDLSWWL